MWKYLCIHLQIGHLQLFICNTYLLSMISILLELYKVKIMMRVTMMSTNSPKFLSTAGLMLQHNYLGRLKLKTADYDLLPCLTSHIQINHHL